MASASFNTPAGSQPRDQQTPSNFRKFDIDTGTEIWRKTLESRTGYVYQAKQPASGKQPRIVEGGLPPHLLFKKSSNDVQLSENSNYQIHTPEIPTKGGMPRTLFEAPPDVFPVVSSHNNGNRTNQHTSLEGAGRSSQNAWQATQHQTLPPMSRYDDQNTRSQLNKEVDEKDNYRPQTQIDRRPIDFANPVLGAASGIRQKFKAKKSCDRASQSLPDTVSSVKSNDGGQESSGDALQFKGITAASSCGPSVKDGSFNSKESKSRMDFHSNVGIGSEQCLKWIEDLPKPPKCFFLENQVERHFECDVEPVSGFLNAPVDYPETHINPQDNASGQEAVRRLHGTAGLKAFADFERTRRQLQSTEERVSDEQRLRWKADPPISRNMSPTTQAQPTERLTRQGQTTAGIVACAPDTPTETVRHDKAQLRITPEESAVSKPWFLRPALEEDLPQLLGIYNWEVENGVQALDNELLSLKDMQRIFVHCRAGQTPFIVVVAGTPAESVARKEMPAPVQLQPYRVQRMDPYNQMLRHEQGCQKSPEPDKILGFGFLSIPKGGLAGNVNSSVCRFQGRAHVYVDAKHRRKGTGRALLHKLTRCCSIYSVDMGTYEWFDPSNSRVCDLPSFNPRNYAQLFVETASRSENDPETVWISKFLDSEGFVCVSASLKTRKIGNDENGQWLDNLVWQLDCQDLKSIRENNQNPYNL